MIPTLADPAWLVAAATSVLEPNFTFCGCTQAALSGYRESMNTRIELPPAREVCPTTSRRLIAEGAVLVDTRERSEIARLAFDVPGAIIMPMSEIELRFGELPRDRQLILACHIGERSMTATYFLMYQGYTQVVSMKGGIAKWLYKGFPVSGPAAPAARSATAPGCGCSGKSAPEGSAEQSSCCASDDSRAPCC
jgi:rhodanese-related sulfurtransferase